MTSLFLIISIQRCIVSEIDLDHKFESQKLFFLFYLYIYILLVFYCVLLIIKLLIFQTITIVLSKNGKKVYGSRRVDAYFNVIFALGFTQHLTYRSYNSVSLNNQMIKLTVNIIPTRS